MAEYRTVRMAFWNDPFIEELEAKAKLLYLYLFTCPHTNNLGILEITQKRIGYEASLSIEEVDRYLSFFQESKKIVYDKEKNLILLSNFIRHQTSTSPKMLASLSNMVYDITSTIIAEALYLQYPNLYKDTEITTENEISIPYLYGMHTLSIPYTYPRHTIGGIGRGIGRGNRKLEEEEEEEKKTPSHADSTLSNFSEKNKNFQNEKKSKSNLPKKKSYGEFNHVLLTEDEFEKLCSKYTPELTEKAIDFLDLHLAAKGKDIYKSHYHAIMKWVIAAVKERDSRASLPFPPTFSAKQYLSSAERRQQENIEAVREAKKLLFGEEGIYAQERL